jgi:hypothetical protein
MLCVLAGMPVRAAHAQQTNSGTAPPRPVRFTGTIGSVSTGRPVSLADVRIMYIDSAHVDKSKPGDIGEVFLDSAKSRVGLTDTSGAFVMRNVFPGHYMINVRRIGFEPFEGLLTIDTLSMDMELGLTQIAQVLPPVTISTSATNRVTEKLDRVGFITRSRMGTSGTFIDRKEILRRRAVYVTDVLQTYGIHRDANITIDRMESDWDSLTDYPMDLVIGIEIYRRRASLPTEFDRTRRGALALGPGGNGGMSPPTVLIWTYIP